jgi:hypothetical protein
LGFAPQLKRNPLGGTMTSSSKVFTLLIGLALALTACSTNQLLPEAGPLYRNALRVDLLGCYVLFDGRGHLLDSSYYNAFSLVLLDSTPTWGTDQDSQPGIVRVMSRVDSSGRRITPGKSGFDRGPSWWVDSLTDTLRMSFSNGFSGAVLKLAAIPGSRDTLRGRIEEHWDVGPPFVTNRGKARVVRIPCATP